MTFEFPNLAVSVDPVELLCSIVWGKPSSVNKALEHCINTNELPKRFYAYSRFKPCFEQFLPSLCDDTSTIENLVDALDIVGKDLVICYRNRLEVSDLVSLVKMPFLPAAKTASKEEPGLNILDIVLTIPGSNYLLEDNSVILDFDLKTFNLERFAVCVVDLKVAELSLIRMMNIFWSVRNRQLIVTFSDVLNIECEKTGTEAVITDCLLKKYAELNKVILETTLSDGFNCTNAPIEPFCLLESVSERTSTLPKKNRHRAKSISQRQNSHGGTTNSPKGTPFCMLGDSTKSNSKNSSPFNEGSLLFESFDISCDDTEKKDVKDDIVMKDDLEDSMDDIVITYPQEKVFVSHRPIDQEDLEHNGQTMTTTDLTDIVADLRDSQEHLFGSKAIDQEHFEHNGNTQAVITKPKSPQPSVEFRRPLSIAEANYSTEESDIEEDNEEIKPNKSDFNRPMLRNRMPPVFVADSTGWPALHCLDEPNTLFADEGSETVGSDTNWNHVYDRLENDPFHKKAVLGIRGDVVAAELIKEEHEKVLNPVRPHHADRSRRTSGSILVTEIDDLPLGATADFYLGLPGRHMRQSSVEKKASKPRHRQHTYVARGRSRASIASTSGVGSSVKSPTITSITNRITTTASTNSASFSDLTAGASNLTTLNAAGKTHPNLHAGLTPVEPECTWSCVYCTYANSPLLNYCEMCENYRHNPPICCPNCSVINSPGTLHCVRCKTLLETVPFLQPHSSILE